MKTKIDNHIQNFAIEHSNQRVKTRTHCMTFELASDGFKPLTKKVKKKAPVTTGRNIIELYSSASSSESNKNPNSD